MLATHFINGLVSLLPPSAVPRSIYSWPAAHFYSWMGIFPLFDPQKIDSSGLLFDALAAEGVRREIQIYNGKHNLCIKSLPGLSKFFGYCCWKHSALTLPITGKCGRLLAGTAMCEGGCTLSQQSAWIFLITRSVRCNCAGSRLPLILIASFSPKVAISNTSDLFSLLLSTIKN